MASLPRHRAARNLIGCFLLLAAGAAQAVEGADTIKVELDRAKIVKVSDSTQTLVVGNPLVADVTLLKGNGSMVLTGRSFGTTNLILLDGAGAPIAESLVQVTAAPGALTVLRGASRESYSCTPRCAPAVALGDDSKYLEGAIGNVRSRIGAAASGGK